MNTLAFEELNIRIKYIEDRLNSLAKKQYDFEATQSDFIERLGKVEKMMHQIGVWHGGYVSELADVKYKYQEALQMISNLHAELDRHLTNRP